MIRHSRRIALVPVGRCSERWHADDAIAPHHGASSLDHVLVFRRIGISVPVSVRTRLARASGGTGPSNRQAAASILSSSLTEFPTFVLQIVGVLGPWRPFALLRRGVHSVGPRVIGGLVVAQQPAWRTVVLCAPLVGPSASPHSTAAPVNHAQERQSRW